MLGPMNKDVHTTGRWIGLVMVGAVVGALTLGACGSGTDSSTAALVGDTSDDAGELALVEDVADQAPPDTAPEAEDTQLESIDLIGVDSLDDLDGLEMTESLFEAMRSSDVLRPLVLEEMVEQGLTETEATCFFDNVSPGLFVVFGEGDAPDDEQFAELMELLVTCDITFAAAPS